MFRRFSLLCAAASVLCGVVVFCLFRLSAPPVSGDASGGGSRYAVLSVGQCQNDRRIREALASGGIEGIISESSQKIPIDDFGALRLIPLDMFWDEIEPFDPRNTGFAEKLSAFFVQGGQRFFFFPLASSQGNAAGMEARVAALLPDVPFDIAVLGQGRSRLLYFILLAAACVAALVFSRSRRFFAIGIPALLALGWGGSSAFFWAALLAAMWEMLREPLKEIAAADSYQRRDYAGLGLSGLAEKLKPFKMN
ncbi:MAG: hypothetical protein FWC65_06425, partial [Treponema sp.]|nr:hypothetical protein [Treponema sp.]